MSLLETLQIACYLLFCPSSGYFCWVFPACNWAKEVAAVIIWGLYILTSKQVSKQVPQQKFHQVVFLTNHEVCSWAAQNDFDIPKQLLSDNSLQACHWRSRIEKDPNKQWFNKLFPCRNLMVWPKPIIALDCSHSKIDRSNLNFWITCNTMNMQVIFCSWYPKWRITILPLEETPLSFKGNWDFCGDVYLYL